MQDRYPSIHGGARSAAGVARFSLRRAIQALFAVALLGAFAFGGVSACGESCAGGVIVNGRCEGKCDPSLCVEDNTCVGNRCKLLCDSHLDCVTGVQDCVAAKEDDTGKDIFVCAENGKAPVGASCPFGNECDPKGACPDGHACDFTQCGGQACVKDEVACQGKPDCTAGKCADGSACTVPGCPMEQCKPTVLGVCPDGRPCDYNTHDKSQCSGQACAADAERCAGDPKCTIGKCPDGAPCTRSACAPDQCKPLACRTSGVGDAEAFCTMRDCHSDAECPGGFYCGIVSDPHEICGTNPAKGNNGHCGETKEACVDPSTFTQGGATYFEGSLCLLRNTCIKRTDCAPCQTDLDCSLVAGQRCVQSGPDKRCLSDCNTSSDCLPDHSCEGGSCVPKFGSCKASGKFCEPCLNDEDCGSKGSTMGCAGRPGGERACVDYAFPACTTNSDCPKAPSGKYGKCLDESVNVFPGDPLYHRCYLPFNFGRQEFSCW